VIEKLKQRSIWLTEPSQDPGYTEAAAELLRDVKGVLLVNIVKSGHLIVSYNVRKITLQII
jgi:hypothetical protein